MDELIILNITFQCIAKQNKFHAYTSTPVQQLQLNDFERHFEYDAHLIIRLVNDPKYLSKVLWTD